MHIANSDKPVDFYSLDIILSVGYRVKSTRGNIFRRWANQVLKQYLLNGYSINEIGKKRFVIIKSNSLTKDKVLK